MITEEFNVTRQSANKYMRELVDDGLLTRTGNTKGREYQLAILASKNFEFDVTPDLAEDFLWSEYVLPWIGTVEKNVEEICGYGFTEMVNNVVDHSDSSRLSIYLERTAATVTMIVRDFGVGIFKKIQTECGLHDERDAILELSKGKLTTDVQSHTGEGIFFSSRMFDEYNIASGSLFYGRIFNKSDWLVEREDHSLIQGTSITMTIDLNTDRTQKKVFDDHAPEFEDYGFTRTHVPVKLVLYGTESLISRSQAKRVLARFDRFTEVILDYQDVDAIGPSFADEIYRVFQNQHPDIHLFSFNTTPAIDRMIKRAESNN
ncbi:MAG: DUF4325 domain-containing protein [Chloroflexi bacterium]|nr:DUF4325 domain-containing protein [Chloroflexota bacterium]